MGLKKLFLAAGAVVLAPVVFCNTKMAKNANKNGEKCISVLENVAMARTA